MAVLLLEVLQLPEILEATPPSQLFQQVAGAVVALTEQMPHLEGLGVAVVETGQIQIPVAQETLAAIAL